MMWGYGANGGIGWGEWLVTVLLLLAFWTAVVAGLIAAIRALRRPQEGAGENEALRILDERLARGDIDTDEYAQRRSVLMSR